MFDRPAVLKIALCRLAGRAARGGPIDTVRFKDRLKLCREQMAAVLASRLDPETTIVLKGNKPLELRIHKRHRAVLYTPTRHTWTRSWTRSAAGASCPFPAMSMMVFRHRMLTDFSIEPFEFRRAGQAAEERPGRGGAMTPKEKPTEPREAPKENTSGMLRLFVNGGGLPCALYLR